MTTPARPACHRTTNPAFIDPYHASEQQIQAAKTLCHSCPMLVECARQALKAGSIINARDLATVEEEPAVDVLQAGVLCNGSPEALIALHRVAGVPYTAPESQDETLPLKAAPPHCKACGWPMIRWNRYEEQPDGMVMHYARGFCTNCRAEYQRWRHEHGMESAQQGLRRPIDRHRHSAPPRKRGAPTVQPPLFDLPA